MSNLTTVAFWKATAERAVRTAAQVALATIGTTALLTEVAWAVVGSTTALAAVLAVLTAVAADAATGQGPSLTPAEQLADPPRGRYADRDGTLDGQQTPPDA